MNKYLPNFLIIGAMKAGTTSLYRALSYHPRIFLSEDKEPETLVRNNSVELIHRDYKAMFYRAPIGSMKGEASTAYAKLPDYPRIPEKALQAIGVDLKVLYITRDPISRTISHYKHDFGLSKIDIPFSDAIRERPELIQYSNYDWQISPWERTFGKDAILVIKFEEFIANQSNTMNYVFNFLNVDPSEAKLPLLLSQRSFNQSENKPILKSRIAKQLHSSMIYQRVIKPYIPKSARDLLRSSLPSRARHIDVIPTKEDIIYIQEKLEEQHN